MLSFWAVGGRVANDMAAGSSRHNEGVVSGNCCSDSAERAIRALTRNDQQDAEPQLIPRGHSQRGFVSANQMPQRREARRPTSVWDCTMTTRAGFSGILPRNGWLIRHAPSFLQVRYKYLRLPRSTSSESFGRHLLSSKKKKKLSRMSFWCFQQLC